MIQIAKTVFLCNLSIMKKVLSLAEFKLGKDTKEYAYFKQQTMDFFYKAAKDLFKQLTEEKILVRCECKAKLRQGYSKCPQCAGSGYKNKNN